MTNLLDHLGIGLGGIDNSAHDFVRIGREAEAAGFRFVRVGDSGFDSIAICAALAGATERIEIRTGVALWSRTPIQTAFAAFTLDDLTRGRFRLGLGTGPQERSEGWHDVSYQHVVGRFGDFVRAIRAAWSGRAGAPASYDGRYYRFRNFALPKAPYLDHLPIDIAANGPQMLRLAGGLADRVLFNNVQGGRYPREAAIPEIRKGEAAAGRPAGSVRISGAFRISFATSKEEAIERARAPLMYQLEASYNRPLLDFYGYTEERLRIEDAIARKDRNAFLAAITDPIVELFFVCGTPDDCRATVASYGDILDEASLSVPTLRVAGDGPATDYRPLIEAFGKG